MKQFLTMVTRFLGAALLSAMLITPVLAAVAPTGNSVTTTYKLNSIQNITSTIFTVVTTVAVIIFVILLLIGGIQYLASFGNEEATTKAKKLIVDAVVGLFIVLAAAGIANFVLGQLGVGGLTTFFNSSDTGIVR